MREIIFEYIYSNGKNFIKKTFTIEEISNGECYEFLSDMPMYKDYKFITYRQYTGLKDKNGKEIYEGDIVKTKDFTNGCAFGWEQPTKNHIVEFNNIYGGYHFPGNGFTFKEKDFEVIGNIYENPNLLTNQL